jgi:ketosteroid isomerase-like protein
VPASSPARDRVAPTPQAEQERLMQQFLATLATGDVERLASMLAHDVVAWSDGGGKRAAARKPIRGPMRVTRFLASLWRKAEGHVTVHLVRVNGTGTRGLSWRKALHGRHLRRGRRPHRRSADGREPGEASPFAVAAVAFGSGESPSGVRCRG